MELFFFFLKGKVEVEERKESLRACAGSCSFGGLCFHASPPQLPSARPQRTHSCPAPSFFSSHERNLPLLPCSPTISDQRIKYGRGSQRGCEHLGVQFPQWGKKEKTWHLSQLRHRPLSSSNSPQRPQLPCAASQLYRRPPGLPREEERSRHDRKCRSQRKAKKRRRRKRLCSMFFFLLSLSLFSLLFLLLLFWQRASESDRDTLGHDGGTRTRAQR